MTSLTDTEHSTRNAPFHHTALKESCSWMFPGEKKTQTASPPDICGGESGNAELAVGQPQPSRPPLLAAITALVTAPCLSPLSPTTSALWDTASSRWAWQFPTSGERAVCQLSPDMSPLHVCPSLCCSESWRWHWCFLEIIWQAVGGWLVAGQAVSQWPPGHVVTSAPCSAPLREGQSCSPSLWVPRGSCQKSQQVQGKEVLEDSECHSLQRTVLLESWLPKHKQTLCSLHPAQSACLEHLWAVNDTLITLYLITPCLTNIFAEHWRQVSSPFKFTQRNSH